MNMPPEKEMPTRSIRMRMLPGLATKAAMLACWVITRNAPVDSHKSIMNPARIRAETGT